MVYLSEIVEFPAEINVSIGDAKLFDQYQSLCKLV